MVPPPSAPPTRLALSASSAGGGEQVAAGDQRPEAGRVRLDLGFDPVGEGLGLARVPHAAERSAGVAAGPERDVAVRPHRLGARRRPRRVGLVHLPDEHERAGRDLVLREVGRVLR